MSDINRNNSKKIIKENGASKINPKAIFNKEGEKEDNADPNILILKINALYNMGIGIYDYPL